jgi:8-oxo-dGTP pyrophosphatase MutT (NUDIX family)
MASLGPCDYVMVALHVGGSGALDIKIVLEREPRTGKSLFLAGLDLPNEEDVDASVRETCEETGFTLTIDDLTLLGSNPFRVPLRDGKY